MIGVSLCIMFWAFTENASGDEVFGGVIHRLLLREVYHYGPTDEMQFMLGNQSVSFSKVEFCLITGLRFGVVPDRTKYAEVENGIHQRYFPRVDEVSLEEIRGVVTVEEFGEAYDVVKLCLIYMLNWILMGVDERFNIPVWQFQLLEDLDEFDAFPWGTHMYRHSIDSFKHAIFAFKVISDLGQEFGTRRVMDLSPRILKWELTKQPRGKKLAKIFKARGSLYVEEDKLHIPSLVPDHNTFGGNSGIEGGV
ncbi:hypothetical protein Ddye_005099 [Dipteronia dyeriana]|uniref:DUF1985 domain-containing protein n=1 Tax=Dipteronia dyeriana TaxID=168575 RepID=A0AAD9XG35_9ROSI|nr:hypothetical protein Ddye_005099 [Dipteronia dyeriana]